MNPQRLQTSGDGAVENGETASSSVPNRTNDADLRRCAVKDLIERYFFQLQRGCGNPKCTNINCASSGKLTPMTANEMAAQAIQLMAQDAKLCEVFIQTPQLSHTQPSDSPTSSRAATSTSHSNSRELDLLTGQDNISIESSGSSNSSNSTITSGSSSSDSSSSTTNSVKSSIAEELPLLDQPSASSSSTHQRRSKKTRSSASPETNNRLSGPPTPTPPRFAYMNEEILDKLLDECKRANNYDMLVNAISEVFGSVTLLSKSFWRAPTYRTHLTASTTTSKLQELLSKSPNDLKKEDLRTLEGENDKDVDSTCALAERQEQQEIAEQEAELSFDDSMDAEEASTGQGIDSPQLTQTCEEVLDLESLRRARKKIFAIDNIAVTEALISSVVLLTEYIKFYGYHNWEKVFHCTVICFDFITTTSNSLADLECLERALPKVCSSTNIMPIKYQARLSHIWATKCKGQLPSLVQHCQQLITLQTIMEEDSVQENNDIKALTKVLRIAYYANILAGEFESPRSKVKCNENGDSNALSDSSDTNVFANDDDEDLLYFSRRIKSCKFSDPLELELGINSIDCRVPLIPFEEFYNESLSEAIHMDRDYLSYKNLLLSPTEEELHFCFMTYSFILTPAIKVIALYYDSRIRMYSERSHSLYSLMTMLGDGEMARPDLKLKVRRDHLITDALVNLEMIAMSNPKDLKKQLVVEFIGEQGIDEGGVSKEFFQLIIEELFNPDFGMFVQQEETNTVWFNASSFENEAQFTLIGIILGLAIYNNIILAVNFPQVVYRKLMGGFGSFYDLCDWNPTLYRSLKSLLDYQEPDIAEVFMQTFMISYTNIFGEVIEHELKPNGGEIVVEQHNKQEFVDLYSEFLLNSSIERQFKAFKSGFEMVTDESPLKMLFRPEEVELLVCGSAKFDFVELEKSTEYEGGYDSDTQIIKDFWSIVHSLSDEFKRKLLEFTTGSDRVPVGGLSRLKLLITRHGPDSDRLPTSHTCFNVLLLPEYSSKQKLEERLLKAINYSKGFGML